MTENKEVRLGTSRLDVSTPKFPQAVALIDSRDYKRASQFKWTAHMPKNSSRTYAMRKIRISKNKVISQTLHRFIMCAEQGQEIDHIDHNGLNCTRDNLRFCTRSENNGNQRKTFKKRSSWAKGVSWHKASRKYMAYINKNGKRTYLGLFEDEVDAANAYNKEAIKLFGKFAQLNTKKG